MHAGVEDDKIYLTVVTVSTEDAGDGQKRSPKVRRKSSSEKRCRTSALDLGTIGAAAGKMDHTSGTSMLRATPAYIYTQGLEILEIRDNLGNN